MREMKDSGLLWAGMIPSNWELKKIKYALQERVEKNNPVQTTEILSLTAKQGVIPYEEKEGGGNKPKEDVSAYRLAYPGDIVMNSMNILSGSVGLSKYYGCVSPVYYMLRPKKTGEDVRFYNYIFQTTVFQRSLFGLGNGILIKESGNGKLNTIRMRIPMDKFGGLFIPIAPNDEQGRISDFLDEKCTEIDKIVADIQEEISLVMTSLFAYPLSKKWLKGQKTVLRMVVFSMFFSGGMIPNYLLVSGLRLTGTVWSILIPFAVNQFYLIILINFFSALPSEIEEAATIDGLGYFGILLRMVIPLSGPALTTIGIYTLVFFWNSWFYPLIYLKSSQYPVMLLLRNIVNGSANAAEGMAQNAALSIAVKSAVILVSSLPILLIYPFFQKYFARGITVGAVKG